MNEPQAIEVLENKEVNGLEPKKELLIALEPITRILETTIHSSCLLGGIPVSAFVVAPSGSGKSKAIIQYKGTHGCHLTNDITSMGLQELLRIDHKNELRTIIIPDFNLVLSHKVSTLNLTIANLLSVMAEGTVRIDDGRQTKETRHDPVSVVTAMTFDMYKIQSHRWAALGLTRRFLPLYYEYSLATRRKIQDSISNGHTTALQLQAKNLRLPREKKEIYITENFANEIKDLSKELADNLALVPLPSKYKSRKKADVEDNGKVKFAPLAKQLEFSPHITLRSLAKANALKHERWEVEREDIDFLVEVMGYTRIDRPGEL